MNGNRRRRWLRIIAIASSAAVLASCRSLTAPLTMPLVAATWSEATDVASGSESCPALPQQHQPALRQQTDCQQCRSGANARSQACPSHGSLLPLVRPSLLCDGGDGQAPAKAVGKLDLKNLTAGDTVARYHAADKGPDAHEVQVAVSNIACVYAPRFASVRHVTQPHEEASPVGPRGIALDTITESGVRQQPVWGSTQRVAPEAARKALPGVALEELLSPLAIDQKALPDESVGDKRPTARTADTRPMHAEQTQTPRLKVGFDVPTEWTSVRGAQILLMGRSADIVANDRGTATLRIEAAGRTELTICKRAGSDTARIGEELDFTIFLLNSGERPLTDVVLVDALPVRLTLVANSPASSLPADFSTTAGDDGSVVLKWQFQDPLPAGESGFVRFRTVVH